MYASRLDQSPHPSLSLSLSHTEVPVWLKSLRLHKYQHLFAELGYEEMLTMQEAYLEQKVWRQQFSFTVVTAYLYATNWYMHVHTCSLYSTCSAKAGRLCFGRRCLSLWGLGTSWMCRSHTLPRHGCGVSLQASGGLHSCLMEQSGTSPTPTPGPRATSLIISALFKNFLPLPPPPPPPSLYLSLSS